LEKLDHRARFKQNLRWKKKKKRKRKKRKKKRK